MRLLLFFLKCLVGLFASIGVLLVGAVVLGAVLVGQVGSVWTDEIDEIPKRSVLVVEFGDGLLENRPDDLLSRASRGRSLLIREFLDALEAAGSDPRVAGLIAHVGRGDLGMAQIQELRAAILGFRAEGKFAYGFAESFGESGDGTRLYYLASAFEEIWIQPSGDLDLTGLILESPYLRAVLDEIGIAPRLDQREEFKGAFSSLTDSALPEPQRRNLQGLLDSWIGQIAQGIAESRGLAPEAARALIDRGPFGAESAKEAGLIDRLGYWDQFREAALEASGEDAELIDLVDYDALRDRPAVEGPAIALIYGLGPILLGDGENDPVFGRQTMGSDSLAEAFGAAIEAEEVAAIVFRVDSPGGSYVASDTIWRAVTRVRDAGKPVIVSMGNLAASGGYFVAAPADKIVAQSGSLTGSIGVVAGKIVVEDLWERLGVNWDGVQAGENADIWSMNRDFSPQGWARLQDGLDRSYADFTAKVASGRSLTPNQVSRAAGGQVWTGADALELGLVDELGGLRRAVELAKESAGIDADAAVQLQVFPEERSGFEALIGTALSEVIGRGPAASLVRGLGRLARTLAPLFEFAERMTADPRTYSLRAPEVLSR